MQSPTGGDPREEEDQFTCTYVVRKITKETKRLLGMATIFRERKQNIFADKKNLFLIDC
jgi:hypothetical protein